jgi:imidazolonepropionase-like amidohydrolase
MARLNIASIPTLVSYQYLIAMRGGYWGSTSRRFTLSNETNFAMAKKLANAGVKLGVGTDLVIDWHRSLPEPYIAELRNLESLGYTKAEALVAATQTNAEILGMDDRLGSLVPGMLADLILVDGKPDENLEDLANINTVIVNGRIEVQEGRLLMPRHTAEPPPTARQD